nr:glycosyltransferase [Desulfovibrio sp.]
MKYASLNSLIGQNTEKRLAICLVTPDLLGPVKNGGIGTACTFLAHALADHGHNVHVLFTQDVAKASQTAWIANYKKRGIEVSVAQAWAQSQTQRQEIFPNHSPLRIAKTVYDWFCENDHFDLVIYMEWQGSAFYALHGKQCGLILQNTTLACVVHSPSLWHSVNNADIPGNPSISCTWHMERYCVEHADAVISPSAYMLDWCQAHGYRMPERLFVQPNLMEVGDAVNSQKKNLQEAVFFGRLEYRKGLEQFCQALDILAARGHLPKQVTFLGKCAWLGQEHSAIYIARRAKAWPKCTIRLLVNCDQHEAVSYLCGPGRFAVMPSVADNSPYTVYECLASGIPFLARDVGGVSELIDEDDRKHVLFDDIPQHLADKMQGFLGHKPFRAKLSFDMAKNEEAWCQGLAALAEVSPKASQQTEQPFISVCVTHHDRPELLQQTLQSLEQQSYQNFEVILADDGSKTSEAKKLLRRLEPVFAQRNWQLLRLENGFVGRARNAEAKEAHGDWLLFFDDDNVATPEMLTKFAKAAQASSNQAITTAFTVFDSATEKPQAQNLRETYCPLGSIVSFSAIHNTIGDTTTLIKKELFCAMQGFTTDYGVGHEDFELLLRLVLKGQDISVLPEPTFFYRRVKGKSSVQNSTNALANRMRSLRPFLEIWPAPMGELAFLTQCLASQTTLYEQLEPELDTEDFPVFPGKDPQSEQVLSDVAIYLENHKEKDLAKQLLQALESSSVSVPFQVLQLYNAAQQAVKQQQWEKLSELAAQFTSLMQSDCYDAHEQCLFYKQFLIILSQVEPVRGLYHKLLQELVAIADEQVDKYLFLATEYA